MSTDTIIIEIYRRNQMRVKVTLFRVLILTIIATLIWQVNFAVGKEYQGEENKAMFKIKDSRLSFSHRKEITIDGTKSSKNLSDYQVRLVLDSSNFDFSEAKPDGADLRFADSDGSLFDYWIENYDPSRQSAIVWVNVAKIPALSKT